MTDPILKVLLTGATGFIGTHVQARLRARGHTVRALVRPQSNVAGLPPEVEVVHGELHDARAALDGMDGVVHLAGVSGTLMRKGDTTASELWRVNVDGTRQLFGAARDAGLRRGVHVTSAWTVLRPELATRSLYIESRLESERAAFAASTTRFEVTCVCPTFVVGSGDRGPNLPGGLVLAFMRGRLPVAPGGGMTWIAVDDAAAAIVAALEHGTPRTRYVIGAEFVEHRALLGRVANITGQRAPSLVVPRSVLSAAGRVADATISLAGRRFPLPLGIGAQLLSIDRPIDCSEAHRELGAPVIPLDHALAEAVAWFRSSGHA